MGEAGHGGEGQRECLSTMKQRHLVETVINTVPLKHTTGRDTTFGEHLRQINNHKHKEFKRRNNLICFRFFKDIDVSCFVFKNTEIESVFCLVEIEVLLRMQCKYR